MNRPFQQPVPFRLRLKAALAFVVLAVCLFTARGQLSTNSPTTEAATNTAGEVSSGEGGPFALKLANRTIFEFRAGLGDYSAEERCAAAEVCLRAALMKPRTVLVTTQAVASGIRISLDGKALFVVTPADVPASDGETVDSTAAGAMTTLQKAVLELNSFSSVRQMAGAISLALLLTAVFVASVWLTGKIRIWVQIRLTKLAAAKTENVKSRELRRLGLKSFVVVLRAAMNLASWLFIAFLAYTWMIQMMRCFPYSRPWGEY